MILLLILTFACVVVKATQPSATYAAGDAVDTGGVPVINERFAGLGHERSLATKERG
jgi:hypothetical protein